MTLTLILPLNHSTKKSKKSKTRKLKNKIISNSSFISLSWLLAVFPFIPLFWCLKSRFILIMLIYSIIKFEDPFPSISFRTHHQNMNKMMKELFPFPHSFVPFSFFRIIDRTFFSFYFLFYFHVVEVFNEISYQFSFTRLLLIILFFVELI